MQLGLQSPIGDSRRLRVLGNRGSEAVADRPIVLSICRAPHPPPNIHRNSHLPAQTSPSANPIPIGKTPASLSLGRRNSAWPAALEIREQICASSKDWNDRLPLAKGYRLVAHQLWANGDSRSAPDSIEHAIAVSEAINNEQPNNLKILNELGSEFDVSGRMGCPGDSMANQKVIDDYRRTLSIAEVIMKIQPDDDSTLHGYAIDLSNASTKLEGSDPLAALNCYKKSLKPNVVSAKLDIFADSIQSIRKGWDIQAPLYAYIAVGSELVGGEGGIRTPGTLASTSDFESGAFNRALPPLHCVTSCFSAT